jgi:hypothetical protein
MNGVQASGDFTVNDVSINKSTTVISMCDDWTPLRMLKNFLWTGKPSTTVEEGNNAADRYKKTRLITVRIGNSCCCERRED